MYATVLTVMASICVNSLDAAEEKDIDQVLESVETVLKFHKHDPSADLAIINKVQKVLDRIKSASEYTEDVFIPNQYRANLANSEPRPLQIHWEDKLFSYEITRNKKKSKNGEYVNRARKKQQFEQTTDVANYWGLEVAAAANINKSILRNGEKKKTLKVDKQYKVKNKESLPALQYVFEMEPTASNSTESKGASDAGPRERPVASIEQRVRGVNHGSRIESETPEALLDENSEEVKKVELKVGVVNEYENNKDLLVDNYEATTIGNSRIVNNKLSQNIAKRIRKLASNTDTFSYKFQSGESHEIVTNLRKTKLEDSYGTTRRNKFEDAMIKKEKKLRDFNIPNNSEFRYKYVTYKNSDIKTEESKDHIMAHGSMRIEPRQEIQKKTNAFQNNTDSLSQMFLSDENFTNFSKLKKLDGYSLSNENLEEYFQFKSSLKNSRGDLNDSESIKADYTNLGNIPAETNENTLKQSTQDDWHFKYKYPTHENSKEKSYKNTSKSNTDVGYIDLTQDTQDNETNENTKDKLSNKEKLDLSLFYTDATESTPSSKFGEFSNVQENGISKYITIGTTADKQNKISDTMTDKTLLRSGDAKEDKLETQVNKTDAIHPFNVANDWDFAYNDFIHERNRRFIRLK